MGMRVFDLAIGSLVDEDSVREREEIDFHLRPCNICKQMNTRENQEIKAPGREARGHVEIENKIAFRLGEDIRKTTINLAKFN